MKPIPNLTFLALAGVFAAVACMAQEQQSTYERFRAHNEEMTAVQPTWMGPLIQPDARLSQLVRLSLSNSYTAAGTRTVNYGNDHTVSVIVGDRIQVNLIAPPYIQNHSATMRDGFGDAVTEVKYRIASGNAEHGNFALTALLCQSLPTGSFQNGAPTADYYPTLAAGRAWGRFDLQTTLGGTMPTGKIAAQGRSIEWNATAQARAGAHLWIDLENNAAFNYDGPFDGKTENFLTPAVFYVLSHKQWHPGHTALVLGAGMQIATSHFHTYNHNLIPEARLLF